MGVVDFIATAVFVLFIVILVVGFNQEMIEKNKKRQEKYKKDKMK